MPTTRSQAVEEKTRVFEESPASPSAHTHAHTKTRTVANDTVTTETLTSRAAMIHAAATEARGSRAPSVRSHRSTASAVARIRQAELEAEEQLVEIKRQELQLQSLLIKKRLAADVATIREETDRESLCAEEPTDANRRVNDWLQKTQVPIRGECDREPRRISPPPAEAEIRMTRPYVTPNVTNEETVQRRPRSLTPDRSRDRGIDRLADALERMAGSRSSPRHIQDLPTFMGSITDWLPFKAAYRESTNIYRYSATENMIRLRTCLKGEARQSVSALLYTANNPDVIINTLEQCYGRPEVIIDHAMEDIKKLPRMGTTASELNGFAVKVQNIVAVITAVDEKGYLQNPMLVRQITERLTPHLKSKWCDYAEEFGNRDEPEIITLSRFLMREADRAVRHAYSTSDSTIVRNPIVKHTVPPNRASERYRQANKVYSVACDVTKKSSTRSMCCFLCGNEHRTSQCSKLNDMSVAERWNWAKETRICFLCLDSKHRRTECKARKCGKNECRQPHHALLHLPPKEDNVIAASAHRPGNDEQVLLKVCPVYITKNDGGTLKTYALLDEGSTITLIDEEIARMVGAEGPARTLNIQGVTSVQREIDSQEVDLRIQGEGQSDCHRIKARTVRNLILGKQTVKPELCKRSYLKGMCEKSMCYSDVRPRILIGADNWHLIVTRRLLSRKNNEPAASLTRLGWVLHGKTPRSSIIQQNESVLHVRTCQENVCERDDELSALVKSHFDIDSLGISKIQKPNAREERAKDVFERTVCRIDGHFEVGLPWTTDEVVMPPSYDMALRRLRTIEKKMDSSPEFKVAYTAQVEQLFKKGYATKCDSSHTEGPRTWYLPHFAVVNPNKPGKLRMVFDAAAKANGTSLNDWLLDGPDMLRSLQGVLFRFREKPIAVTADIREMFLQVKIREEDRAAQHFLWRGDNRTTPPEKYVMTSMIFGARSSPFLAHSVRNRNAEEHRETHPLAYHAITRNHYMDDWVESFDTMEEASRAINEVRSVHSKAGFELAGWSSNRSSLLRDIPTECRTQTPKELGATSNQFGKTLGVLWLPQTDELAFNTARHRVPDDVKNNERSPTKREALSAVMSIFDPLGLISPYTITAKIMLQGLWRENIGWDEPLPPAEATVFSEWQSDISYVSELRLPRVYNNMCSQDTKKQLHVFCDASEEAYAAAAYWRFQNTTHVTVTLVAAKARVAPMKAQSIPRMELQAALIGARLATEILKEHEGNHEVIFWSDSKTVLHWIRNDSVRYTPYVAHRLGEIAELTEIGQWRWVPTAQNVADDSTRSGYTRLKSSDRWFVGPAFLYETEDRWPVETTNSRYEDEDDVVVAHTVTCDTPVVKIERFSSYERAKRTVAYVFAFIDKCRKRADTMNITHIKKAEQFLIKLSQKDSFPEEIARLAAGKNVDRTSRLYKLDPMYGTDGIIRLNGRINASSVHIKMKEPPILDGAHHLSLLIIRNSHKNNHHSGREHIVNEIRQQYWVLRLRPSVKKALRECGLCRLRKSAPVVPVKGNLPNARLDAYTRPFSRCGVDCFGPMTVTIGRRREKRWGMLFTCLVTRAIHIETVASLSTDSAIMSLRRMAARRGWPEIMWSDNGTNFRGASVELNIAYREWIPELQNYVLSKHTEWKFTDPGAPNQGGAWERLIRSVKTALAVTLNERAPREEVLATVLTEIEHTVNSRPLTYVASEYDDAEALTPNHFLIGSATGVPHVGECQPADRKSWRAAQALANMFWSRWLREYLPTLTPRGDVRTRNNNQIKVGNLVVIADGLLPRNVWPKGQVEKIYVGPDGVVRSADVRTRGGTFRRPVRRLIVLPGEDGLEDLRRGEAVTDR